MHVVIRELMVDNDLHWVFMSDFSGFYSVLCSQSVSTIKCTVQSCTIVCFQCQCCFFFLRTILLVVYEQFRAPLSQYLRVDSGSICPVRPSLNRIAQSAK
jgi:hypothetical protein